MDNLGGFSLGSKTQKELQNRAILLVESDILDPRSLHHGSESRVMRKVKWHHFLVKFCDSQLKEILH